MTVFAFEVGTFTTGTGTADNACSPRFSERWRCRAARCPPSRFMAWRKSISADRPRRLPRRSSCSVVTRRGGCHAGGARCSPAPTAPLVPAPGVLTNLPVGAVTGSTQAVRSNSVTLAKKNFTFNLFGGIVKASYQNTQDRFQVLGQHGVAG